MSLQPDPPPPPSFNVNRRTMIFVVTLCSTCAIILAVLAYILKAPQEKAKELDRSKQMLIAAQIYAPQGYFQIKNPEGQYVPAKYDPQTQTLIAGKITDIATANDILSVYNTRIVPYVTNRQGELKTFQEASIDEKSYLQDNKKTGFASLEWKLLYAILPNISPEKAKSYSGMQAEGYIFPIAGFGLWDAIYGYIAIANDGDHVIGITWYAHAETPGLGAVISEPDWQKQFPGKVIFQEDAPGKTDFKTAAMGIIVVRGKVSEVFGNSPKALSAVDGIAGATITGNGVTKAYKDSLTPYRAFLIKVHEQSTKPKS